MSVPPNIFFFFACLFGWVDVPLTWLFRHLHTTFFETWCILFEETSGFFYKSFLSNDDEIMRSLERYISPSVQRWDTTRQLAVRFSDTFSWNGPRRACSSFVRVESWRQRTLFCLGFCILKRSACSRRFLLIPVAIIFKSLRSFGRRFQPSSWHSKKIRPKSAKGSCLLRLYSFLQAKLSSTFHLIQRSPNRLTRSSNLAY